MILESGIPPEESKWEPEAVDGEGSPEEAEGSRAGPELGVGSAGGAEVMAGEVEAEP